MYKHRKFAMNKMLKIQSSGKKQLSNSYSSRNTRSTIFAQTMPTMMMGIDLYYIQ